MIDLHTHTNESDGSYTPEELIRAATAAGLQSLAITDHDTFNGYSKAREFAERAGLDLIRGIELSTRDGKRPIHLLGYFLGPEPDAEFLSWLTGLGGRRQARNILLAERLERLGVPVQVEEANQLGRSVTGRVHFAYVMIRKGYVQSIQEAFRRYLGEDAPGYVEVDDPPVEEAIARLRRSGGFPVIAHPGRYRLADDLAFLQRMAAADLGGVEAVHSDHGVREMQRYESLAAKLDLLTTGGSDFHGDVKPGVRLGYGDNGKAQIPPQWLDRMRRAISGD